MYELEPTKMLIIRLWNPWQTVTCEYFTTLGNRQTLEVQPKAKGIDIRQELIKFYEENYSANLMRLVVYGKGTACVYNTASQLLDSLHSVVQFCKISWISTGSLDKIQDLVIQKFNAISNNKESSFHISGHPCVGEHLQVHFCSLLPFFVGRYAHSSFPVW